MNSLYLAILYRYPMTVSQGHALLSLKLTEHLKLHDTPNLHDFKSCDTSKLKRFNIPSFEQFITRFNNRNVQSCYMFLKVDSVIRNTLIPLVLFKREKIKL